jgi:hypothetical protein
MARQRFQAGIGGTLRFLPPEARLAGAPTSPTISVLSSAGQDLPTPVKDAVAVVDQVATTLDGLGQEGERALVLVSVAGIAIGRKYLVTPADGQRFLVEVDAVDPTANRVVISEALQADVESGAAFAGVELSYALSGAQCPAPLLTGDADLLGVDSSASPKYGRSYRAEWHYTIGGVSYASDVLYEVRRRVLKPTLSSDEVQRRLPAQWRDLVAGGPREVQRVLDDVWDDVLDELAAKGFDADRIMDGERLRKPHRSAVVAALAKTWDFTAWGAWAKERSEEASQDLQEAIASGDWYDDSEDAVQAPAEVKWPTIRLTR